MWLRLWSLGSDNTFLTYVWMSRKQLESTHTNENWVLPKILIYGSDVFLHIALRLWTREKRSNYWLGSIPR